ncbi:MAG TPA: hypothetical protein VK674_06480 [Candidatus Limnocylindria bacterium]|nr:hypothetical protein [Candidatus Limnocylindria bacterium]
MKNITLSAQDDKIEALKQVAKGENKTVNQLFREWLDTSIAQRKTKEQQTRVRAFEESVKKYSFTSDRKLTREEMNER